MGQQVERIFDDNVGSGQRTDEEALTYEALVRAKIDDSVDYEESYLAGAREENQAFYNALRPTLSLDDDEELDRPNKSNFISSDVRDTILTIMPSLIRIFTGSEKVMEFVPNTEEDQDLADLMYDYANYVFYNDNQGFLMLYALLKDALTVKYGVTKWWTDIDREIIEQTYHNVTIEDYQVLLEEGPDVEVVELEMNEEDEIIETLTLRFEKSKPLTRVEAVPPDEFRIARNAKSAETANLLGHERTVPLSDLVKKGYDPDELRDFISSAAVLSDERYMRNPALVDDNRVNDGVVYGEWYIRVDGDGDGIDELRHICTIGNNREIVSDYAVSEIGFALWASDPKSHTAIGDCMADITKDIQTLKSQMVRGQIDSLASSINPRMVVNQLTANIEDALNDEVGAIIRVNGVPQEAVHFIKEPYSGAEVQVTVDYLDRVRASRTGITEASKGLDPKAMQSTTLSGIDAIISGAQERIELIARVLAETGLKPTFRGLIREIVNNPNAERQVRLRGKFVKIQPSLFDASMGLEVNPTIGKGSDMVRLQALQSVEQKQMLVLEKYGLNNPVVSPIELVNTIDDQLAIVNIKNPSRYFKRVTPEIMESIAAAPKEPDPATVLAQAELEKTKKDMVIATDKSRQADERLELDATQAKMDDDYRRDKLNVDAMVRVLDITTDPKPQVTTASEPRPSAAVTGANKPG